MGFFDKVAPETVFEHSRRMWETKLKDKYPYHAESLNNIAPNSLPEIPYGRHGSVVMKSGVRTWGFEKEFSRDHFLHNYREAKAI